MICAWLFTQIFPVAQCTTGVSFEVNTRPSSPTKTKDTREVIDIARLNAEVKQTVERIDALRADIDAIIKELEDE